MKRIARLIVTAFLLASCVPSTESPTPILNDTPSLTSTSAAIPIPTNSSTPAPAIPTTTIPPMAVAPVSASPLTLNELNAGTGMKRLNVIGTGTPHDLEFSTDGKQFAVATGRGVYLYDGTTFVPSGFIDINNSADAIAFSPDGSVLAVAVNGRAGLWNVQTGQNILELEGGMISIFKLAYGRGGYVAAIGGECRGCGTPVLGMILWDARTGQQIFTEHDIWYSTSALTFTADGKQLVFGGNRGVTTINSETGRFVSSYNGSTDAHFPYNLMLNNDESGLIISTYWDKEFTMIANRATQQEVTLPDCGIYLAQAKEIAACSKQNSILIIDGNDGQTISRFAIDVDAESLRNMFALSPDGRFLIYYGKYGLYVLDAKTGNKITTLNFTDFAAAQVGIVEIDGAERYAAATLGTSGQVNIYDIQTGEPIRTLSLDCCEITGFSFAPDHKTFAAIDTRLLRLWDLQTGAVISDRKLTDDFSGPIAFSPDGLGVFLTNIAEGNIFELDFQSGKTTNQGKNRYAYNYADPFAADNYHFNRQGNLVVLGYEAKSGGNYSSFTDVVTGEKIVLPYNAISDSQFLETFAISPGSQYLVFGNAEGIFVWDIASRKQISHLDKHEWRSGDGWMGAIKSLIFNPQSNLLVSVGWDQTTRLWNISTGSQLRLLNVCCSASFTPDGRYLVTAGDGVIRVWGIP